MTQSSVIGAQLAAMEGALDRLPSYCSVRSMVTFYEMEELRRQMRDAQRKETEALRRLEEERIRELVRADLAAETAAVMAANLAGWGPLNRVPGEPGSVGGGLEGVKCTPLESARQ